MDEFSQQRFSIGDSSDMGLKEFPPDVPLPRDSQSRSQFEVGQLSLDVGGFTRNDFETSINGIKVSDEYLGRDGTGNTSHFHTCCHVISLLIIIREGNHHHNKLINSFLRLNY